MEHMNKEHNVKISDTKILGMLNKEKQKAEDREDIFASLKDIMAALAALVVVAAGTTPVSMAIVGALVYGVIHSYKKEKQNQNLASDIEEVIEGKRPLEVIELDDIKED